MRRKIEEFLKAWAGTPDRLPVIIKGVRQCGKTYSVLRFARQHYKHCVYINFFEDKQYHAAFKKSLRVDDIILSLSAILGTGTPIVPHETCLVFDEIQECPEARTALKFFKLDGRYDVIATGSLLGVSGFRSQASSIPVGYEMIVDMYPMDFEEFLWANGISDGVLDSIRRCISSLTPIPEAIHQRMWQLLLSYTIVGGMPAAVKLFCESHQPPQVLLLQRAILRSYEDDMLKYAAQSDKGVIRDCFASIPRQLAKENSKFQYSVVRKGSGASRMAGSLQWIEDAGIIRRCYNLTVPQLPLDGNAIEDVFKVYMADTGLFTAMLEDGTQGDILLGTLSTYKGAIYENLMADMLGKQGRRLYYFRKDSGLEIDFITRIASQSVALEVKATTGNAKSLKTLLAHRDKYGVAFGIKLGNYNIGRTGQHLTLPLYAIPFLGCLPTGGVHL